MIRTQSVLVFICFALALLANVNARPHRRDLSALATEAPQLITDLKEQVADLLKQITGDSGVGGTVKEQLEDIDQLLNQLSSEVTKLGTTATNAVIAQLKFICETLEGVQKALNEVTKLVGNLTKNLKQITEILTAVKTSLTSLLTIVLKLVVGIVSKLTSSLQLVTDVLGSLEKLKAKAVGAVLTQVTQTIKGVMEIKKELLQTQNSVNNIQIQAELSVELTDIDETLNTVVKQLSTVNSLVQTLNIQVISQVHSIVEGLLPVVKGLLTSVLGLVSDLLGGVLGGILGGLNLNLLSKRAIY